MNNGVFIYWYLDIEQQRQNRVSLCYSTPYTEIRSSFVIFHLIYRYLIPNPKPQPMVQ